MKSLKQIFQRHKVSLAYLFGSQTKKNIGPMSDVDIAVLFNPQDHTAGSIPDMLSLTSALGKFYPGKRIDLTDLNRASPLLKREAVLKGKLLYSALKPVQSMSFEKKILQEYEDTKRLRSIYLQYLKLK